MRRCFDLRRLFRTALLAFALAQGQLVLARGDGWMQVARLRSAQPNVVSEFGSRIALDGPLAVTTARESGEGVLYVFRRSGAAWQQEARLILVSPSESYAEACDVDGDTIAVGARDDSGQAFVVVLAHSAGGWVEQGRLFTSYGGGGALFGGEVAVSGDRIAVSGRPTCDIGCAATVEIYERRAGSWTRSAGWFGEYQNYFHGSHRDLDLDGDRLVLGDSYEDEVRVWRHTASGWTLEALLAPSIGGWVLFGECVALDGDRLAVGAPEHGVEGAVYVYRRSGNSWSLEQIVQSAQPTLQLGSSVALSGAALLAGHPLADGSALNQGAVHSFVLQGGTWSEASVLWHSAPATNDALGDWVALSGEDALASLGAWASSGPVREHVYAYALPLAGSSTYCLGDGSGTPCPCGNDSDTESCAGCLHHGGQGARLAAFVSTSVAADALELVAHDLVPNQAALLFSGASSAGTAFGDGLLCVAAPLRRLGLRIADGIGSARFGPGLVSLAGWSAGSTQCLQAWYRDPTGPCGSGWNLSSAVALTLTP